MSPRIICVATGTIWRWSRAGNRDALLDFLRGLPIDGVELTFSRKEELYAFNLSPRNRGWLRGLRYVSLHAPFRLVQRSRDARELDRQLGLLARLSREVRAKTVVIHPNALPPPGALRGLGLRISTENLPPGCRVGMEDLRKVLRRHPGSRLCLDVSHAYLASRRETGRLVRAFKGRISQVHLSGTYRRRDHRPLGEVTRGFRESIRPLRGLDRPIVLEGDLPGPDRAALRREIELVRALLG